MLPGHRVSISPNTDGSVSHAKATLWIFPLKGSPEGPLSINAVLDFPWPQYSPMYVVRMRAPSHPSPCVMLTLILSPTSGFLVWLL